MLEICFFFNDACHARRYLKKGFVAFFFLKVLIRQTLFNFAQYLRGVNILWPRMVAQVRVVFVLLVCLYFSSQVTENGRHERLSILRKIILLLCILLFFFAQEVEKARQAQEAVFRELREKHEAERDAHAQEIERREVRRGNAIISPVGEIDGRGEPRPPASLAFEGEFVISVACNMAYRSE